ncbi:MAG: hypothetical protein EGR90_05600 [Lachnospiraceae bacterium]|nr:hypothetical protein [Lachnospiraceae bacterium]
MLKNYSYRKTWETENGKYYRTYRCIISFEKGTLFFFCGKQSDCIKELLWMRNGFLQLCKRLAAGSLF